MNFIDATLQSNTLSVRDKVFAIEKEMKKFPQAELHVNHYFSHGVYARELIIPKGAIIVGMIHKYANLNMLVKGELFVLVDDEIKQIEAPFTIVSSPGTKRIAYAKEDSIWITVHGTHETDLEKIEEHFIAKSEDDFIAFCNEQPKLPFDSHSEYKRNVALVNKSKQDA